MNNETELLHFYEHFAFDGKLLRAGITNSPHDRTGQYETEDYWPAVEWIRVEHWWTTRTRILEYEAERIRQDCPPFNKVHNPMWVEQELVRSHYLGAPVGRLRRVTLWGERLRRIVSMVAGLLFLVAVSMVAGGMIGAGLFG